MRFQTAALMLALTTVGVVIATGAVASVDRSAPPEAFIVLSPVSTSPKIPHAATLRTLRSAGITVPESATLIRGHAG
jgi:hypothetical protein